MSRSRHKRKLGKCICGRGHIPYRGDEHKHRGKTPASCPILDYPHQVNDQRETHRKRRERLIGSE